MHVGAALRRHVAKHERSEVVRAAVLALGAYASVTPDQSEFARVRQFNCSVFSHCG